MSDGATVHPPRGTLTVTGPGAPAVSDSPATGETVLTFPEATVQTKAVDGASAPITKGYAAMMKNGKLTLASSSALATSLYIAGLVLAAATAGQQAQILTSGLVDPTVLNVGAGVVCAVGLDANGKPVRVTDPTCVSGLKHVGVCDVHGAIYVSPTRKPHFDVTDFGAVADSDGLGGGTDSLAAFQACIDAAGIFTNYNGTGVAGGRVFVPDGRFRLSGALHLRRSVHFEGANGNGWFGSAVLCWDKDVAIDTNDDGRVGCLTVDNYLSGPASSGGVAGMRGDWSEIRNLVLSQAPGGNPFNLCHGIAQISPANIRNVLVTGFQGDGLRACTYAGYTANVDGSQYDRLFVQACGRHGVWMKGTDAQVCEFGMIVIESCGVWGIKEESFFGNHYKTLLLESNGYFNSAGTWAHGGNPVGGVRWSTSKVVAAGDIIMPVEAHQTGYQYKCQNAGTVGASEPTWPTTIGTTVVSGGVTIVCWEEEGGSIRIPQGAANATTIGFLYTESDQNGARLPKCSVLGGLYTLSTDPNDAPAFSVEQGNVAPIQNVVVPSAVPLRAFLGYTGRQAVLAFQRQAESEDFALQWEDTTKAWQLIWAGAGGYESMLISAPDSLQGPNRITFPDGFSGGRGANQRQVRWLSAVPDATTTDFPNRVWAKGDLVLNTSPSSGGALGWICTGAGGWGGGRGYTNRTWTTGLSVYAGDGIEPTVSTGYVYQCTSSSGAYGAAHLTSGTEPTWPTSIGTSVTGGDGITWKCVAAVGATFCAMAQVGADATASNLGVRTITASAYTVDASGHDDVLLIDTTSNAVALTLLDAKRAVTIVDKANNFATHACTLTRPAGSGDINGAAADLVLNTNGQRVGVVGGGTADWYTSS